MFSFDELCELVRVVSETRVGGVEVEREGMRVRIDGVQTGRPYSISSRPGVGFVDVTVREKTHGFVSLHLLGALMLDPLCIGAR